MLAAFCGSPASCRVDSTSGKYSQMRNRKFKLVSKPHSIGMIKYPKRSNWGRKGDSSAPSQATVHYFTDVTVSGARHRRSHPIHSREQREMRACPPVLGSLSPLLYNQGFLPREWNHLEWVELLALINIIITRLCLIERLCPADS